MKGRDKFGTPFPREFVPSDDDISEAAKMDKEAPMSCYYRTVWALYCIDMSMCDTDYYMSSMHIEGELDGN